MNTKSNKNLAPSGQFANLSYQLAVDNIGNVTFDPVSMVHPETDFIRYDLKPFTTADLGGMAKQRHR